MAPPDRGDAAPSPSGATRRVLFAGWSFRRMGVSLTAAVFAGLMLGTSVFAGSRAGGPLYEPRLALEELGLPTDPGARVDAQLQAAQVRLAEAVEASGRHDNGAAMAALAAYGRVLFELESATGPAADRALVAIQFHHSVLEQIAETAPIAAADGLARALVNNERLMERLTAAGTGPGSGTGGPNGAGWWVRPDQQPGAGDRAWRRPPDRGSDGGGDPEAWPANRRPGGDAQADQGARSRPEPTPEPADTPEPNATDPDPTEHPRPTPRPRPSNPGGGPGGAPESHGNPDQERGVRP